MIELLGALRRRWPLTLVAAILVIAAGAGAWSRSSPTYEYGSTVLLLPPPITSHLPGDTADYTRGNPLFYVGTLNQTRDILIGQLTSKDLEDKMAHGSPGVSYTAAGDILNSSPVVVLSTEGTTDAASRAAIKNLTASVSTVLTNLQERLGIKPAAAITSQTLEIDKSATISNKKRIRATIMALGVVGLICLVGLGLIDKALTNRRARRQAPADRSPEPPAGERATAAPATQERRDGAPAAETGPAEHPDGEPIPMHRRRSQRGDAHRTRGDEDGRSDAAVEPPTPRNRPVARR